MAPKPENGKGKPKLEQGQSSDNKKDLPPQVKERMLKHFSQKGLNDLLAFKSPATIAFVETFIDPYYYTDPLEWDLCPKCKNRGKSRGMFHCDICEEVFHPHCISDDVPYTTEDPHFKSFTCPKYVKEEAEYQHELEGNSNDLSGYSGTK